MQLHACKKDKTTSLRDRIVYAVCIKRKKLRCYTYCTQRGLCAVCLEFVCVWHRSEPCKKIHEPIEMRFGAQIRVNPRNGSVDGGPDRSREETCMTGLCADTLWTADSSLRSRWSQPIPRSRGVTQQQRVLSPPLL